jgi:hypothetical protein
MNQERGAQFVRRREDFDCAICGRHVVGTGYTNHCPGCVWSRHVDDAPGDRLAECRGMMRPIGAVLEHGEIFVVQRCEDCGHTRRNRTASEDDMDVIRSLLGNVIGPDRPGRRQSSRRRPADGRRSSRD